MSKPFEYWFLDRFRSLLTRLGNEYGFKKVSPVATSLVDNYVNKGTTANICSIDLSKVFDKVNLYALFNQTYEETFSCAVT